MEENKMGLIDSVFEGFVVDDDGAFKNVSRGGVNIWLPEDYVIKFRSLQARSKKRFGKKVQELVIKAIDRVSV